MKDSIRVSEKHGVNPSLGLCFWCGTEDGTVLLLGKLPGDAEAPRRMCVTYEPCDKCRTNMESGIVFIEATPQATRDGQPALRSGAYPTGRWAVVREEAVRRIVQPPDVLAGVLRHRKAFLEPATFTHLLGGAE